MGQINNPEAYGKKQRWSKIAHAPLGNFSNLKQINLVKKQDNEKKIAGSRSQMFKVLAKKKKVTNPASVNISMANDSLFFNMGVLMLDEFFFNGLGQIKSFHFFPAGF
jgi:hypothetical protein